MILYGNDHKDRAEALAVVLHEESKAVASLARSSDGIVPIVSGDAILTVWGHSGDATKFAEMLDVEFGVLIQAWKKKNPSLKSVELITCDAQHNMVPLAGYAKRVAKFVEEKYKDIAIKALPVGQHPDDQSILWANAGTRTYCYITAPSQATFDHANQRLQTLDPTYHHDLSEVGDAMAKERGSSTPNNFTVNFGSFNNLRATLNVVKP